MTVEAVSDRILIADDDESLCRTLHLILKKKGYYSETALSGEEAIKKAGESSYNLALLDIRLPDMHGLELLTQLSEIQSDMDMIMITGHASVETAQAAIKTKAAAYIVKPIDMQELINTIEKVLERQQLIYEREFAEDALRKSEDKYRALFDSAPIAIAMTDNEGRFIAGNHGMENLTGYSWHELKDMKSSAIYNDIQDRERALSILMEEGRLQDFETKLIKKNGLIFSCLLNWDISEIDGQMMNSVTLRDISAQKQAEEDLRATAETSMLHLDIMGHDIRNHLMAIVMGTEILQHHEFGPEVLPIFELIVDSVHNSQELINRILNTRNLLNVPLSNVSLSDALEECVRKATKEFEDATIRTSIEVAKAQVRADKYISYLFSNLLDNAISHNPRIQRQVWIRLKEVDAGFEVTISDDGTGISDDRKESLFDPERRFGGVGIHQAKSILKKYNGRLSVHDRIDGEPEQGAKFRIWLPKTRN